METATLREYLSSKLIKERKNTKKGKCSNCGECCSNILPLSRTDIERIKNFIAEHGIKAETHITNSGDFDMSCPFLTHENRCRIYDVRPFICRKYKCNLKNQSWKNLQYFMKEKLENVDVRYTFFADAQGFPPNIAVRAVDAQIEEQVAAARALP